MSWEADVAELRLRQAMALKMGGEDKVQKQHGRGKLTARERLDRFFDRAEWFEVGMHGTQMGPFFVGRAAWRNKG